MKIRTGPLKPGWYPTDEFSSGVRLWRWVNKNFIGVSIQETASLSIVKEWAKVRTQYSRGEDFNLLEQPSWYQDWLRARGFPVGGEG